MASKRTRMTGEPRQATSLWRLMLVIILMFWILAALLFGASQWLVPALYSGSTSAPSGFNYGQTMGVPFFKTWGLWVAGILFVLGPLAALWKAFERGGEAMMAKALGKTNDRRGGR